MTGVAAMTVALGVASLLYLQRSQRARAALKEERLLELRDARNALVLELRHLDAERDAGSVGPASYQRMRDEMMRALGRVLKQMETV